MSRGAELYAVLHHVTDPGARILLVGPLGVRAAFFVSPWARGPRYLAA
jgi:hypothetical protein